MPNQGSSKEADVLYAGMDEVGMGCLAGPLCIAVAIFPKDMKKLEGVGDSKKIYPNKRKKLAPVIMQQATFFGLGWAQPEVIDELGMAEAWRRAATDALEGAPDVRILMIDGDRKLQGFAGEQQTIIKGDAKVWQIGAASIVAKVVRDMEMVGMSKYYPAYGFERNKGYGTEEHIAALRKYGPCPYHRKTFLKNFNLDIDPVMDTAY